MPCIERLLPLDDVPNNNCWLNWLSILFTFEGNPRKVEKPQRGTKEAFLLQKLKGLDKGLAKSGTEEKLRRWW